MKERRVIKLMAIDYKKEWKVLQHIYGKYMIQDQRGIPSIPSTLDELMNFQIQRTIMAREKLMGAYVKEMITTDIGKVDEDTYAVRIFLYEHQCGTINVGTLNFDAWCKKRKEKNDDKDC